MRSALAAKRSASKRHAPASADRTSRDQRRVASTRFPDKETVADATQGVQLATVQKLADYWARDYDWSRMQAHIGNDGKVSNTRIHGEYCAQLEGCQDSCAVRNTRSGCGIAIKTRPSSLLTPVTPAGEPLGFSG